MARISEQKWEAVRTDWESDPVATMTDIAERHGIGKGTVSRKMRAEKWQKRRRVDVIGEREDDVQIDVDIEGQDLTARHKRELIEIESFRRTALAAMKQAHENGDRGSWGVAYKAAITAITNIKALGEKQNCERITYRINRGSEF